MILKTERLELVPLLPYQLKLWVENIPKLEKDLNCSYQAEPMEGLFLEIVILAITYGIASGFWFAKVTGL